MSFKRLFCCVLCTLFVTACGYRGALYLPEEKAQTTPPSTTQPTSAPEESGEQQ